MTRTPAPVQRAVEARANGRLAGAAIKYGNGSVRSENKSRPDFDTVSFFRLVSLCLALSLLVLRARGLWLRRLGRAWGRAWGTDIMHKRSRQHSLSRSPLQAKLYTHDTHTPNAQFHNNSPRMHEAAYVSTYMSVPPVPR